MHVLHIIISLDFEPRLIRIDYDSKTKVTKRIAVFQFDENNENAQEIDYSEVPKEAMERVIRLINGYLHKMKD